MAESKTEPNSTILATLTEIDEKLRKLARKHKQSESAQREQARDLMEIRSLYRKSLETLGISYTEEN